MVWTKKRLNNLFFFIGVAAVVVMLFTFDISFAELWQHLCQAGYWLIPIIGIWVVIYAINAWAWMCIIKGNLKDGEIVNPKSLKSNFFLRIYRLTITGYALNYATPVGGLGGEPYRIMELSKDIGTERATSSVILYAMMHFLAHFLLWFSTIFLYLALAAVGDLPMTPVIGVVFGAIIVFCLAAFYVLSRGYKNGVAMTIFGWLSHIPGIRGWATRFQESHEKQLLHVDEQIAALHRQDKRSFYSSLALEYLARIVQALEILFMLLLFGVDCGGGFSGITLTFLHSILILSLTTLLANLLGFLPMQLGVQEGGFVVSIAALGLSAALGIFVSIICRVREIIWIAIGILLMKIKD
ncbi:MAG: flippase-like domain-containing protein [Prevotella sp.]|nr:flippase-like domain-containing protein [Prevotella sp.]